jgi:DNA-binding HxlR family transcriptional regulator
MWGAMVHRAGVGPEPCTIDKLTVDILAKKLSELKNEGIREKVVVLSKSMKSENC